MSEVSAIFETVVEELLSKELTPPVNSRSDINDGYCGVAAAEVYERLGKPDGMKLCRAGTQSDFHYWIEYDGEFYDAERTEGVSDWQELPFWKRHPNVTDFKYDPWVKHTGF